VPASGDSEDDCGEADGMYIGRGNRSSRRKPVPAPLLSITKSHMTRPGFEPRPPRWKYIITLELLLCAWTELSDILQMYKVRYMSLNRSICAVFKGITLKTDRPKPSQSNTGIIIFYLSFIKMLTNILFQMIYPIIIYLILLESNYMLYNVNSLMPYRKS
jgi:hypothetical protein